MEYAHASKRKTKNDKRAKSRYNRYKKGGSKRTLINIEKDDSKIRKNKKKSKKKK